LRAVVLLRKFVSIQDTENYQQLQLVHALNIYSRLSQLLATQDSTIQYEIAWLLTNICAGPTDLCWSVYQHCLDAMIHLLSSPDWRVRWQAAWCVGNIAGDSTALRDALFTHSPNLVSILMTASETQRDMEDYQIATTSLRRITVWVVGNLGRWEGTKPFQITPALPLLKHLLLNSSDQQMTSEILRTLKYVLHEPRHDDVIQGLDIQLVARIVECLGSDDDGMAVLALRVLTNITSGDDDEYVFYETFAFRN
jgi:importin subunit alpha-1